MLLQILRNPACSRFLLFKKPCKMINNNSREQLVNVEEQADRAIIFQNFLSSVLCIRAFFDSSAAGMVFSVKYRLNLTVKVFQSSCLPALTNLVLMPFPIFIWVGCIPYFASQHKESFLLGSVILKVLEYRCVMQTDSRRIFCIFLPYLFGLWLDFHTPQCCHFILG